MVDSNTVVASVGIDVQGAASSLLRALLLNVRETIFTALKSMALVLEPLLSFFGISLTPTGYVVVAAFTLAAILYSLHKMTWNVLKALVVGVIVAMLLSEFGIIK